ncbi:2-(1,2-epoxy-1,2-dihydrophenyl)acetyl-CoA isomerase [Amycolatopsis acidicola]|uniref:2-(1,2-epoxy-1,2-dihydrophenyl)acetyl-CoA isomerase n=1 Tax=Amycolatopsis acidicola TaxID=2596893 RepID=A0A5N0V5Z7_9PSEU|nr:enoyl-CoA hydratase-related protein [Amycolatopsis acidicola]KAA9160501.1 2-(1,2-epoxy-1,2-dihydrophenyl)acetyl-CoA isomerase [Amycolatopsis acidicola]
MGEDQLRVDREGPVAIVTLNRPERLNALSHGLLSDLRALLGELEGDSAARAIVLTGAGRAFSAGADLRGGPSDTGEVVRTYYNPLILDLVAMSTPVIAAVNGVAAGAAVSLALACDLRIAADTAEFQLSFVKVGLVPDAGATWLLPRVVGAGRAADMALRGRPVRADEALRWGLVTEVADGDKVLARAVEIAAEIAALSTSVGTTRGLLNGSFSRELAEQLGEEAIAQGNAQHGPDYQEARRAFAEKRAPRFG